MLLLIVRVAMLYLLAASPITFCARHRLVVYNVGPSTTVLIQIAPKVEIEVFVRLVIYSDRRVLCQTICLAFGVCVKQHSQLRTALSFFVVMW